MTSVLAVEGRSVAPAQRLVLDVVRDRTDHVVVTIAGEVCAFSAPGLATRLWPALDARPRTIVLDLRGVTFFAAAGITVLIDLRRRADDRGIRVELVMSHAVQRVLTLCDLDDLAVPAVAAAPAPEPEPPCGVIDLRAPRTSPDGAPSTCPARRPPAGRRGPTCS